MNVRELITELLKYNLSAEVSIVANSQKEDFSIGFEGSDGVESCNSKTVILYVDRLSEDKLQQQT